MMAGSVVKALAVVAQRKTISTTSGLRTLCPYKNFLIVLGLACWKASKVGHLRQQSRLFGVRVQRFEQLQVLGENFQDLLGIQRIAFGAAGLEGLAELGHRRGMNRIEDQEVIAEQSVN